jgi:hypothetical protein
MWGLVVVAWVRANAFMALLLLIGFGTEVLFYGYLVRG